MRCILLWLLLTSAALARPLPYAEHGYTPRQAAAHMLNRFAYGARPGEVDRVVAMGVEVWFSRQLGGQLREPLLKNDNLRERKVIRAVISERQVAEVMTDFWFNHFNVSTTTDAGPHVRAYEEEAIRPFALGHFRQLLGATAHHPAMLQYLDNANSTAGEPEPSPPSRKDALGYGPIKRGVKPAMQPKTRGINENYARELLELHTLGVDGGYTQQDIIEVARALTGWGIEGQAFRFRPENHDWGPKTILRKRFPAGHGPEEGERILDMLARHPSTGRNLGTKLARRFVCDDPPEKLIRRLATRFTATRGDVKEVLWELATSPEFWQRDHSKIKSPLELVVSGVRALGAQPRNAGVLVSWVERMGQPLYAYGPPTGFPDRAEHWINPGLLLQRINFGAQLPREVGANLERLVSPAPATVEEAIRAYARVLLPERAVDFSALEGKANQPAEVVGVLLGSPEFQRR